MSPDASPAGRADRDESTLRRLRDLVRKARGIDLSVYKRSYLLRRLAVRQRAAGIPNLADYVARTAADPAEIAALLQALTVNVSEFFRNPSLFRLLEEHLLPEQLAACARERRPFQAWSAGCATGDEVYSIAILLARLGPPPDGADLLGTDLDSEAIAVARAGAYEPGSLREVPEAVLQRCFEPAPPPRSWKIRSPQAARIQFRVHDVLRAPPRRGQDLVLCRNLLIYLEPSLQEAVLLHLAAALRPGGVLVLGRVERLSGAGRSLFEPIDLRERTYRRARGV